MRKRLLAIIATAAMVVAMVPSMVFAATVHEVATKAELTTKVANMNSGDTIKLTNDISMGDSPLSFTKEYNVTLDLNGHTLDGSGKDDIVTVTGADTVLTIKDTSAGGTGLIKSNGAGKNFGAVYVRNGKIIIESGTFEGTNDEKCYAAYASTEGTLIINGGEFIAKGAGSNYGVVVLDSTTLEINGGTITSNGAGITGNGNCHNTSITINGGTIEAGDVGIYHPQVGKLTVNDGVIKGKTGIEMRSGELIVNGGTIEGDGPLSVTPDGNGSTTQGAAIAVAQHTTKNEIDVTINGGTFKSDEDGAALNVSNPQNNEDTEDAVAVVIDGGLFEGAVKLEGEGTDSDPYAGTIDIKSGEFKDYFEYNGECDGNYICIYPGDGSPWTDYVGEEEVKEALEGLKAEDTLDVYELESGELNNIPEGTKILNYTGKALKVNGKTYEYVAKEVVGDDGETYTEVEPITAPAAPVTPPATSTPESAVDTGDDSNTALPFAVAGLALAAMAAVVATRRRTN